MKKDIDNSKICAAISYLFPIGLAWYLLDENMKKNKFVKFHVHQSIVAMIFVVAGYIAGALFSIIGVGYVIYSITFFAILVWLIQGLINSLSGKEEELFLIGHLGKNIKI